MKRIEAAELERAARPIVDAFVSALAQLQADTLNELRDRALAAARATIEAEAAPQPAPKVRPVPRPKRVAKPVAKPVARHEPAPPTVKGKPRQRAVVRCGKCGELGKRADGCGKTHNVPSDDTEDEPRAAREANHVEERVIPHAALVAMLAADRARPGDIGGYVARSDREPSLVGHTEEKRELCPVHGWVGRVAFAREHFKCLPVGEPCSHCGGRKLMATSAQLCDHCDATGIEPPSAPTMVAIEPPVATVDEPRRRTRESLGLGPRSTTIAPKKILRRDLAAEAADLATELAEIDSLRPKTRADCIDGPRPCPWVSCKYHLAIDVSPETGSIKLNFPDVEPWELEDSCALDVADRGGVTLEDLGAVMNLTRERIRQIELDGLHKLKATSVVRHGIGPGEFVERGEHPIAEAEES